MNPDALEQILPVSKKDQIVNQLRTAILSSKIAPGEPIIESRISQQLGVGTPLVREALIELEHQGFVQKVPYKGTTVTKLNRSDIEHIFRLRAELEAIAMEWAKARVTETDLRELKQLLAGMKQSARSLSLSQFYESDLAFHRKIWELSGNPYLVSTLERIVMPLFAFFLMKTSREKKSYLESAAMHEKLLHALAKSSPAAARKLMKDSLTGWKKETLSRLFPDNE